MIESDYLKESESLVEKLMKMPSLKNFDEKDFKGALSLSKIRKYKPGELILEEGSYDSWIYFLVSGQVKIVKGDKKLSVLNRIGDIFGEMGVIDGSARSASVYAVDETVCLATDASYMDKLSGNDKVAFCSILYKVFAEMLANRLRLTSKELVKAREQVAMLKAQLGK